ncbi:unnamed protein product [Brassica oleracea var. botrytis]
MEEVRFQFNSDCQKARKKALDYIFDYKGVKSVELENSILIVQGEGLNEEEMKRKMDKILLSPKTGFLSCLTPKK